VCVPLARSENLLITTCQFLWLKSNFRSHLRMRKAVKNNETIYYRGTFSSLPLAVINTNIYLNTHFDIDSVT
jgi:hypothetical protein